MQLKTAKRRDPIFYEFREPWVPKVTKTPILGTLANVENRKKSTFFQRQIPENCYQKEDFIDENYENMNDNENLGDNN